MPGFIRAGDETENASCGKAFSGGVQGALQGQKQGGFSGSLVPAVTTVHSKAPISSSAKLQTRLTNCAGRHSAPYPVKWLHGT
jgi:hypothetical protein